MNKKILIVIQVLIFLISFGLAVLFGAVMAFISVIDAKGSPQLIPNDTVNTAVMEAFLIYPINMIVAFTSLFGFFHIVLNKFTKKGEELSKSNKRMKKLILYPILIYSILLIYYIAFRFLIPILEFYSY